MHLFFKAFSPKKRVAVFALAMFSFQGDIVAQDAKITGLVYHYTGYGLKSLDGRQRVLAERNKLHLFAETESGRFTWYTELEFASDLGFLGETNVTNTVGFKEAYINYSDDNFDARVGFQIINWGFSNGLYGLDQIAVFDLREALTQDYATIRRAIWSGLVSFFPTANTSIDLFLSPGPHPAALPDPDSPWGLNGILPTGQGSFNFLSDDIPSMDIKDPEVAIRANLQSEMADYSLTYMDVFSRLPVTSIVRTIDGLNVQNHYFKYQIIGGNISTSLFDPLIVGIEMTHALNTLVWVTPELDTNSSPVGYGEKDVTSCIFSLTNSNSLFDGQVTVSLRRIHDFNRLVNLEQNTFGISGSLYRSLLDEKLRLEFLGLSPDLKQHWMLGGLRYAFSDQLDIFGGAQFYGGEVDLLDFSFPLALYGQKDLAFIEIAYTF